MPDHQVLERCLNEDLVIVTENASDFRSLVARADIHPGLIVLPNVSFEQSRSLLCAAIAYLDELGNPMDVMVNHVLEVSADRTMRLFPLP